MTILASFAIAALLVWLAAKAGIFHGLAGDEADLWPHGVDEPVEACRDRKACEAMEVEW